MYDKTNFGAVEVELKATAATAPLFRRIFSFDLLKTLAKMKDIEDADEDKQIDEGLDASELINKLGFVMCMQAEKADFSKIKIDDYYTWLDRFEPNTISAAEILRIYHGNETTTVTAKKEDAIPSEN